MNRVKECLANLQLYLYFELHSFILKQQQQQQQQKTVKTF